MPRNLYADVDMFRRRIANSAQLTATDAAEIVKVQEAAARSVDDYCGRKFYTELATRYFDGDAGGYDYICVPDLQAATSVKLDEEGDGTYGITLASPADYRLIHFGHDDQNAPPFTRLVLNASTGQRGAFASGPRLVEVAGRWGFTEATEDTLEDVPAPGWTDSAVTLALSGSTSIANGALAVGQTLKVESEQMYVRALTEAATDTVTVDRGVNGTTPAAHAAGVSILRYVYEPGVREAALILAARVWKRRETSFSNVISNPVIGEVQVYRGSDPDVERLLRPYVRWAGLVA